MERIYIFGHKCPDTDSILSALVLEAIEKTMGEDNVKAYRLGEINKETEYVLNYFGVKKPDLLEKVEENDKVMLVDHNSFNQSVSGIEKAKIVRVIDHHRIADFETNEPLFYLALPVGCTATVLRQLCKSSCIEIDKTTAGLMLSCIISDTLLLKSPTTTKMDIETANELAKIAGLDINSYGIEMLKAGTDLSGLTPEELINIDSKLFTKDNVKYQVAQINTVSIEDVLKGKQDLENAIQKYINENKLDLFVLMITDILENNSKFLALGKQDIVEKAFNVKLENNVADLPGIVSRKKQVIPNINNAI